MNIDLSFIIVYYIICAAFTCDAEFFTRSLRANSKSRSPWRSLISLTILGSRAAEGSGDFRWKSHEKRRRCFRESHHWIMHGALSIARRNRNELYRRIVNREKENRRPFSSYGREVDRPSCGRLSPYARDMCGAQCMRETQTSRNRFSKLVPELP